MPYVSVDEALNATVVAPVEAGRVSRPDAWRTPLVASEDLRIVLLRMHPGEEPHLPHRHPRADEVMIVVEGLGAFTVGDEPEFEAGPRSLVFVPRDVVHRIRIPGPEPLMWLSIVAPNQDAPDEAVEVGT